MHKSGMNHEYTQTYRLPTACRTLQVVSPPWRKQIVAVLWHRQNCAYVNYKFPSQDSDATVFSHLFEQLNKIKIVNVAPNKFMDMNLLLDTGPNSQAESTNVFSHTVYYL